MFVALFKDQLPEFGRMYDTKIWHPTGSLQKKSILLEASTETTMLPSLFSSMIS